MTETIREFGKRLALEALVNYCATLLEQNELSYSANDLSIGFGVVADLQLKQIELYNKELEETPVVQNGRRNENKSN